MQQLLSRVSVVVGAVVLVGLGVVGSSAQAPDPLVASWKLNLTKSKYDPGPAPRSTMLKIDAAGKGFAVAVDSVGADGKPIKWGFTSQPDGKDMPVTGNAGTSHAAVRQINDRINEIINKKDGKVTQVLTNVLSPDGNTIAVMYMRDDGAGRTTNVSFATYERCAACE